MWLCKESWSHKTPMMNPLQFYWKKIRAEKQRLFEEGKLKKKGLVEIEPVLTDDNTYYGKVPINWCTPSIQNIGEVVTGNTPSKNMKSITMAIIHSSNQLIYYREKN